MAHNNKTELEKLYDSKQIKEYLESIPVEGTRTNHTKYLRYFYTFMGNVKILKLKPVDFRTYFQHVESQNVGKATKSKRTVAIKDFIYFLILPKLAANEKVDYNYELIFSSKFFTFSQAGEKRAEEPFTKDDVSDCLAFFRPRNERDYMMFSLLAYTGMRVGGLCNIQIKNVNIQERTIKTQEKKTKVRSGFNTYFIPMSFVNTLEAYLLMRKKLYPNQQFLFPILPKTVRKQIKRWRDTAHPHLFRDALNTRWEEMKLEESIRAILLNQKPSGVNSAHYLKKYRSISARKDVYDRNFPY